MKDELLKERIKNSGYKLSYLADKLGVAQNTFSLKVNGKSEFTKAEIFMLCALLDIDDSERDTIFLP